MLRLHLIASLLLAASVGAAAAAGPQPSSSSLPGRERDRFTDSPVERFMQPGPYRPPPVVEVSPNGGCTPRKARRGKPRVIC
jgi:hypothetical protein